MTVPLWQPSEERVKRAQLTAFAEAASRSRGEGFEDYAALHRWSIEEPDAFWREIWSFCDLVGEGPGERVLVHAERMPGARWFPDARLNFAENLLRRRDSAPALIFQGEGSGRREISFAELYSLVGSLALALRGLGVGAGDRVAGYLPNLPESVIAMLASASLGAVWTSCSPDFGTRGVLDRFGQVSPRILFCADGYFYNGKRFDCLPRLKKILAGLSSVEHVVVVPHLNERPDLSALPKAVHFEELTATASPDAIPFARLPFDHPLYILFSSGTTGKPKCIVHGAGGSLVQHQKEQRLHVDLAANDRFFYFTTCGWMMWNWLASGLASGASLILYDGSPFHRDGHALFELVERERITVFGTSAKFLDAVAKAGIEPGRSHDLSSLQTILSTGSPLLPEGFDFVYEKIATDVLLASISGGTDIISCFVLGNPTAPVWRGEIQSAGLGMKVEVFDQSGRSCAGEPGELVCSAPFPSMPVGFWNDPDGRRYRSAYFEKFPGVWCHGDWIRETEHGGFVISGRSDAVLNPGGVRFGTAEIYAPVERLEEVVEALAVAQEWRGDTRVVLFVRLRDGREIDDELVERIKRAVRRSATPRHVPAHVLQVPDIPRTRSGKISELAVREVIHGRSLGNIEALENPDALQHFRNRPELITN